MWQWVSIVLGILCFVSGLLLLFFRRSFDRISALLDRQYSTENIRDFLDTEVSVQKLHDMLDAYVDVNDKLMTVSRGLGVGALMVGVYLLVVAAVAF